VYSKNRIFPKNLIFLNTLYPKIYGTLLSHSLSKHGHSKFCFFVLFVSFVVKTWHSKFCFFRAVRVFRGLKKGILFSYPVFFLCFTAEKTQAFLNF